MRVYRIEHPDTGYGPWHSQYGTLDRRAVRDALWALERETEWGKYHLPPRDDFDFWHVEEFMDGRTKWLFACADEDHLTSWFPDHVMMLMIGAGYALAVYEAERIQQGHSGRQVAFDSSKAVRVGRYCLKTWHEQKGLVESSAQAQPLERGEGNARELQAVRAASPDR